MFAKKWILSAFLILLSASSQAGVHWGAGFSPFVASPTVNQGLGLNLFVDYLPGEDPEVRLLILDLGLVGSWEGASRDAMVSSGAQGRIAKNFFVGARAGVLSPKGEANSAGFGTLMFSILSPERPFEATVDLGLSGGVGTAYSRFTLAYRFR